MLQNLNLLIFMEGLLIIGMALFRVAQTRASRRVIKPLYMGAVALVPPLGLFLPNYNYFFAFLLIAPFAAGGDRKKLVGLYLALLLQFPGAVVPYTIGGFYLGTVSAINVLNLGALLALFTVRGRERRNLGIFDLCAWGFCILFAVSIARGLPFAGISRQVQSAFLAIIPPYLVLSRTIRTREEALDALLVFTWSAFLGAIVALFEAVRGWPLYQMIPVALHVPAFGQGLSATLSIRAGLLRAQGPVNNPTSLGILLAMAALFAPALKRHFTRPQIWGVYGALILALTVSQSRGAWIAAAIGYMVRLLFQRRYGPLGGFAAIAAIFWIGSGLLAQGGPLDELLGRSGAAAQTADYRANLLQRGLEEISKHPLAGQAPDQLQTSMNDMRQGEGIIDFVNTHLYMGLVMGLGGMILWLMCWYYPFITTLRAKRRQHRRTNLIALEAPASAFAACFVAILFTSLIDRNASLIALDMGLLAAFVRIAGRDTATAQAEPSVPAHSRSNRSIGGSVSVRRNPAMLCMLDVAKTRWSQRA